MTIAVTGGRGYMNRDAVLRELKRVAGDESQPLVVHGACRGLDLMAAEVAFNLGWRVAAVPAMWDIHGKSAGPLRSAEILARYRPDVLVAFPGGRGTYNMVAQAKARGIRVVEVSA